MVASAYLPLSPTDEEAVSGWRESKGIGHS